ncbi:hypothetical protein [Nocardia alni]|uniref:hypothetical protein n=1 Tax=Nocardia alni TaxID=2815723 RepID=UPI001C23C47D|nr:hypothetical protein [Nocardia alni]
MRADSGRRRAGLHFRLDWEAVVSPVVDFALGRPEVDADRPTLIGTDLGDCLAARAAAFDHRIAVCMLHDGVYSFHAPFADIAKTVETDPRRTGGRDGAEYPGALGNSQRPVDRGDEGGGEHCHGGATALFHQTGRVACSPRDSIYRLRTVAAAVPGAP